jgi:hypothetical protein
MFQFLKNHPFGVEAFFESSTVLTFAVPKKQLQELIPGCLELDTFNDTWAFIAIAMVQTKALRPVGFPAFFGNDFFLIGYRIFVRYKNNAGKSLRGLYIIKSETDMQKMEYLGNIFTQYKYTTTDIFQSTKNGLLTIQSKKSKFNVLIDKNIEKPNLPQHSPFIDWRDARRFAGPLPFTFTYNLQNKTVLIIEGVRQNWIPKPIQVEGYSFNFLQEINLSNAVLANAFVIENIPYSWKKGKVEKWIK